MKNQVLQLECHNHRMFLSVLFSLLLIVVSGCNQKHPNLTFKSGLKAEEIILTDKEKNQIIEFLSEYEFLVMERNEYYYGGALYIIEYEIDGITHHWHVSGSAINSHIREEGNAIYYTTYDISVIQELSKYIK